MGSFEMEYLQVEVGGFLFRKVDLPEEVGLKLVDTVGQAGIFGRGLVYQYLEGNHGHPVFAVQSLHDAVEGHVALCRDLLFLDHALGNHVQDPLQRGGMQSILQVYVQRLGHGVAAYRSLQVEFHPVDIEQGIVQGDGALGPVELDFGLQPRGYAVSQQFTILPEEDVLVVEVERQHRVAPLQVGAQFEVGIPQVGKDPGLAVVVGDGGMAYDDTPYVYLAGNRAGRGGIGLGHRVGGHNIPVGHAILPFVGIEVDAVEAQPVEADFLGPQIVGHIDHDYRPFEGEQRVGALPQRVAYRFRHQRTVGEFHPESREGREEGQLHALHVEFGVQVLVGDLQHDGSQLFGREYEIDGHGDDGCHQYHNRHQRDSGNLEYFFGSMSHIGFVFTACYTIRKGESRDKQNTRLSFSSDFVELLLYS